MNMRRWSTVVVGALALVVAGGTTSSGVAAEVEAPVAVVSVPVVSTSRSATLDLPVRWSAPGASGPVTFTVQYRTVGDNGMDVRTYSTPSNPSPNRSPTARPLMFSPRPISSTWKAYSAKGWLCRRPL